MEKDDCVLDYVAGNSYLGKSLASIESLRSDLETIDVEVPGLVVLGSQSAGKSSVLQSLTGISFPRSQQLCTRFPIVVSCVIKPDLIENFFTVSANERFEGETWKCSTETELHHILLGIQSNRIEQGIHISESPIYVQFTKKRGIPMCVIDLPGLVHNISGMEDGNAGKISTSIAQKYIGKRKIIILLIISAKGDNVIENSPALSMVRINKKQESTIGIITKLDTISKVSEKVEMLQHLEMCHSQSISLKHGYFGVRNKLDGDDPSKTFLELEEDFFKRDPVFRNLEGRWGYKRLAEKIVSVQDEVLRSFLPPSIEKVRNIVYQMEMEMQKLRFHPTTVTEKHDIASDFVQDVEESLHDLTNLKNVSERGKNVLLVLKKKFENLEEFFLSKRKECIRDKGRSVLLKQKRRFSVDGMSVFDDFKKIMKESTKEILFDGGIEANSRKLVFESEALILSTVRKVIEIIPNASHFPLLKKFILQITSELVIGTRKNILKTIFQKIEAEKKLMYVSSEREAVFQEFIQRSVIVLRNINSRTKETMKQEQLIANNLEETTGAGENFLTSDDILKSQDKNLETFIYNFPHNQKTGHIDVDFFKMQIGLYYYVGIVGNRFCEEIPMMILTRMIFNLPEKLGRLCRKSFREDERLNEIVLEDPHISKEREILHSRYKKYRHVLEKLENLQENIY